MKTILTALVSVALCAGIAGAANADQTRRKDRDVKSYDNSPSSIAERQRHKRTFDETQYYERDSNKIPFGTAAWWRQKDFENGDRR
jgi:hypothetical protein